MVNEWPLSAPPPATLISSLPLGLGAPHPQLYGDGQIFDDASGRMPPATLSWLLHAEGPRPRVTRETPDKSSVCLFPDLVLRPLEAGMRADFVLPLWTSALQRPACDPSHHTPLELN